MTYFLVNPRFPDEFARKLEPFGKILRAEEFGALDFPVSAHPDMMAANICGRLFIHSENAGLAALLAANGIPFEKVSDRAGRLYPNDVALNLFILNGFLFANANHISKDVLSFAEESGISLAHVKQGYAKCSAMLLGNALVTADRSISKAAEARGIDALLISPGSIDIEKYDTGFIGGASGTVCKGKTAVFGNILRHPEGEKILAFARAHGEEIISLGEGTLFDYGGIIRIDT